MASPFRLSQIEFNGGDVVDVSSADIVVFVGPNNVGKSRSLQEIVERLHAQSTQGYGPGMALKDVQVRRDSTPAELWDWLKEKRHYVESPLGLMHDLVTVMGGGNISFQHLEAYWKDDYRDRLVPPLAPALVKQMWAGERLGYLNSPPKLPPGARPDQPLHYLLRDAPATRQFQQAIYQAFGYHVIVDAWGVNITLRVSPNETQSDFRFESTDGRPDFALEERLSALPLLAEQSDGVRSFAGILLTLLSNHYPLVLIDEPEAFLHPPQAKLLGRSLADLQKDGQTFVATHSLDILLGLVEARPDRVLVVRLTRSEGKTYAKTLSPADLSKLWKDPLLRFSRVLDGIFHDGVIVTEGDTDSQFFSAVEAHIREASETLPGRHFMYTYAGGKQRIAQVAKALRALGVAVQAVVDFDAMNDKTVLSYLVTAMGHQYTNDQERNRNILDADLRNAPKLTIGDVRSRLESLLEGREDDEEVSRALRGDMREVLAAESGWKLAKKSGLAAVPHGAAFAAVTQLIATLAEQDIAVIPSGAVESFVRSVGGKSAPWVVDVIEGNHIPGAKDAQLFLSGVLERLTR